MICFVTGVIVGVLAVLSRGEIEQASVAAELATHIAGLAGQHQSPGAQEILQGIVGSQLFVVVVWVLAFARVAGFLAFMVVMMQGVSYGFTTAALVAAFGVQDAAAASLVYLPQALVLTPVLLYVCTSSVSYVCSTLNGRGNAHGEAGFRRYCGVLVVAVVCAAVAGLMDVYLAPFVARQLL